MSIMASVVLLNTSIVVANTIILFINTKTITKVIDEYA